MRVHLLAVAVVALFACGPVPDDTACRPAPAPATALLDPARLLVSSDDNGQTHVDGRAGSTAPGARVTLGGLEAVADERGAFSIVGDANDDALVVARGDDSESQALLPRTRDDAHACTVGAPVETGTLPNDVALVTCDGTLHAAVVLSAEGAIDVFDAGGRRRQARATFAVQDGVGAEPFSVALVDEGPRAVVTLFGQHAVALVDLCAGLVLDIAEVRDDAGDLVRLALDPALTLTHPLDVDRDGTSESVVTRYAPRHPQSAAVVGAQAFVGFTNHIEPATAEHDQLLAPGTLARFRIVDDTIVSDGYVVLTGAQNPQAVVATPLGLLVSFSGPFARGSATSVAADGALTFVDGDALVVTHQIDMGRFAPARPAFASDRVVVGSLLHPEILVIDPGARTRDEGVTLVVDGPATESLFDAASLGLDLVLVTAFTGDRLHVVDLRDLTVNAWPFTGGLSVVDPAAVFRGALALDVTSGAPGRASGAVLLGLSSEIVWLTFSGMFGP